MLKNKYLPFLVAIALMLPGALVLFHDPVQHTPTVSKGSSSIQIIPAGNSEAVLSGYTQSSIVRPDLNISIMVTLGFNNPNLLNRTLNELQNPLSPSYHHFLSSKQFISEFSPSPNEYSAYVSFFRSQGLKITNTYADRLSIGISSNASQLEKVFHTNIVYFNSSGKAFYAPNSSLSIDVNYGQIAGVTGLSDQFKATLSPMFKGGGSGQSLFGSDLQNAYQLSTLYAKGGYPTNLTVATILWSGLNSTGGSVAPYVPSDISTYLNNNLPSGQPRSKVYGDPVGGAPLPGPSAANDTNGTNYESTLDLEMAGSTAPGATIVEVYGPQPTQTYLDQAFAEILNPTYNATLKNALAHVVAISNSWGGGTPSDSAWNQYEQEAAARGITVLAASGDNGNTGSVAPSFPASSGYDNYGSLAVGGSLTILSGSSSSNGTGTTGISSQSVWYGTPYINDGSQGGVSTNFAEPSWQLNSTDANAVIRGNSTVTGVASGRGTPDVAGVGANMEIYITLGGGSGGYSILYGTSIASPLVAGEIATMDSYLGTNEGFINPSIYKIGQEQYGNSYRGPSPFYFIYNGSNGAFSSARGYNLATGWGSINAYNFILAQQGSYNVTFNETGLPQGTAWSLNLSNGDSFNTTSANLSMILANGTYNYTAFTGLNGYSNLTGNFTVAGSNVSINLTFNRETYTVNFTETGLPSGNWYVNISNANVSSPHGVPVLLALPNGTYSYTVQTDYKNYEPVHGSGNFTVDGANVTLASITFLPVLYRITFTASGLYPGTSWNLTFNGKEQASNSTNYSEIVLYETNGTYSYSAWYAHQYTSDSFGTRSLTVNGKNLSITFNFTEYSYIEGDLSPAGATIYANGVAYGHSTNGTYFLSLAAGNYTIEVSSPGYVTQYYNVTLVAFATTFHNFNLTQIQNNTIQPGGPRIPLSGNNAIYALGVLSAVIVIGVLAAALRRRR